MSLKTRWFFSVLPYLCFVLFACSGSKEETPPKPPEGGPAASTPSKPAESEKTIQSAGGVCEVSSVGGWQEAKGLHKKAQLQISNPFREMYLVVFSEKKQNYADVTLEDHSKITREHLLETLTSPSISAPQRLDIGGNSAIQYEIRGLAGNIRIVYLHTDVEGPMYFHEIVAWTLDSRYNQNKFPLQNTIKSFKELEPVLKKPG